MRILHVLHHSLPLAGGYTVRSRYIFENQLALGLELSAVTSAQHPNGPQDVENIGGIDYHRTRISSGRTVVPLGREYRQMRALERNVHAAICRFHPDVIHAHSPVLVGLPALRAARRA